MYAQLYALRSPLGDTASCARRTQHVTVIQSLGVVHLMMCLTLENCAPNRGEPVSLWLCYGYAMNVAVLFVADSRHVTFVQNTGVGTAT